MPRVSTHAIVPITTHRHAPGKREKENALKTIQRTQNIISHHILARRRRQRIQSEGERASVLSGRDPSNPPFHAIRATHERRASYPSNSILVSHRSATILQVPLKNTLRKPPDAFKDNHESKRKGEGGKGKRRGDNRLTPIRPVFPEADADEGSQHPESCNAQRERAVGGVELEAGAFNDVKHAYLRHCVEYVSPNCTLGSQ
ncbi:hypothetical protein EW146_g3434 [Bondarzewia mesenterica]|uniref:Uncharacterized protein n=1 Tax=Bondarzewia mesenterica TaxID=1095465 RepID=A0A4S4M3G8_9AGAM|nr:hypothetical protein EW146_g3434 [Bondarzewia mesenterica]